MVEKGNPGAACRRWFGENRGVRAVESRLSHIVTGCSLVLVPIRTGMRSPRDLIPVPKHAQRQPNKRENTPSYYPTDTTNRSWIRVSMALSSYLPPPRTLLTLNRLSEYSSGKHQPRSPLSRRREIRCTLAFARPIRRSSDSTFAFQSTPLYTPNVSVANKATTVPTHEPTCRARAVTPPARC